jgi:hypothetical protein
MTDREIVEEFALVNWIDSSLPTREILNRLMTYSTQIAVDIRVSPDAVALYDAGYNDALAGRPRVHEPKDPNDDPFEALETSDETSGHPPAADPYQP